MKGRSCSSLLLLLLSALCCAPVRANVVISQVYGGGGNSGATYKNDFIELFNAGATSQSLAGWSVQYASATGTSWSVTPLPNVLLPAGTFFLIGEAAGGGATTDLPTPDASGTTNLSTSAGKVVLYAGTGALSGTCPVDAAIQDLVGYGTTANCFETSPAAGPVSNANAVIRTSPCTDTDDNAFDFVVAAANPRNSTDTAIPCIPPIDYAALQFPPSATIPACQLAAESTIVYGRVYIAGVTGQGTQQPGIVAQLGIGPSSTDPSSAPGWQWSDAAYNALWSGCGNDDEYQAPFSSVHASDSYDYAYRFSYLGGSFVYADLAPNGTTDGYSSADAGKLTVSGDDIYCDRFDQ